MELNVIAMGKLGGHELNFSSDIDLICCYDSDGELSGYGQLSYQEYFSSPGTIAQPGAQRCHHC